MTFEEILDQAIAMLQRRGHVTYRTLQRRFNLDNAFLEDLTEELIHGQQLVVDEDGKVLVWSGGLRASRRQCDEALQDTLAAPGRGGAGAGGWGRRARDSTMRSPHCPGVTDGP